MELLPDVSQRLGLGGRVDNLDGLIGHMGAVGEEVLGLQMAGVLIVLRLVRLSVTGEVLRRTGQTEHPVVGVYSGLSTVTLPFFNASAASSAVMR